MPPAPAAIAILEFGKLLHEQERKRDSERDLNRIKHFEDKLIEEILRDGSPSLRLALDFSSNKAIDSDVLRIMSYVAFSTVCTGRLALDTSDITKAVAGDEAAAVLASRQTVSQLLVARQLALKNGSSIELGRPLSQYLAGGKESVPLKPTEWDLERAWWKQKNEAATRRAKARLSSENLLTPKCLAASIAQQVIGLDKQIRSLSCRLSLHVRRAAMIRAGKDPSTPNEALLFIGPSGCGKTFLAETAGRISNLPFASISSGDLTAEGFVGLSMEHVIRPLLAITQGDVEKARFGLVFMDEWDKKAASETQVHDIGGTCVQQEMLRLMEGTEIQIGGRRGGNEHGSVIFNTHGTMWLFGGAYVGLDRILNGRTREGVGFHECKPGSGRTSALYEALEQYGMIPEWLNRLSGILVLPAPTFENLVQIAKQSVIPSFNRVLTTFGVEMSVSEDGIHLMAECAAETKTYARGLKSVTTGLIESLIFDEQQGVVRIGKAEVNSAITEAGLAVAHN